MAADYRGNFARPSLLLHSRCHEGRLAVPKEKSSRMFKGLFSSHQVCEAVLKVYILVLGPLLFFYFISVFTIIFECFLSLSF